MAMAGLYAPPARVWRMERLAGVHQTTSPSNSSHMPGPYTDRASVTLEALESGSRLDVAVLNWRM